MTEMISVNEHSSVLIRADKLFRADPFHIKGTPRDADVILITHSHYDHFSPEDISRAAKKDTVFIAPRSMAGELAGAGIPKERTMLISAGETVSAGGAEIEAVPAYNIGKPFHPRENGWLGYILNAGGKRIYIMGDSDATPEAGAVKCDILMIPIGGRFTMDAAEAAALTLKMMPGSVIPIHYGTVVGGAGAFDVFEKALGGKVPAVKKLFRQHRTTRG